MTTIKTVTSPGSAASAQPCTGADLTGTFKQVAGSAGAGQIEYELEVKNTSHRACSLHGIPRATLLGTSGTALPTHIRAGGAGGSVRLLLEPGASAVAQARFSPDVAGPGDSQSGACQPRAHTLQVTPTGGGVMDAPLNPPTSVCERGTLSFRSYGYAG